MTREKILVPPEKRPAQQNVAPGGEVLVFAEDHIYGRVQPDPTRDSQSKTAASPPTAAPPRPIAALAGPGIVHPTAIESRVALARSLQQGLGNAYAQRVLAPEVYGLDSGARSSVQKSDADERDAPPAVTQAGAATTPPPAPPSPAPPRPIRERPIPETPPRQEAATPAPPYSGEATPSTTPAAATAPTPLARPAKVAPVVGPVPALPDQDQGKTAQGAPGNRPSATAADAARREGIAPPAEGARPTTTPPAASRTHRDEAGRAVSDTKAALAAPPAPAPPRRIETTEDARAMVTAKGDASHSKAPAPETRTGGGDAAASPELTRWKQGVQAAQSKLSTPGVAAIQAAPQQVAQTGQALVATKKAARPDHTADALKHIKPPPKIDTPPSTEVAAAPPASNPVPDAIALVRAATKALPAQKMPDLERSPGHPRLLPEFQQGRLPIVGGPPLAAPSKEPPKEAKANADQPPPKSADKTKAAEAKKKQQQPPPNVPAPPSAVGVTLHDLPPSPETAAPIPKPQIKDTLASIMARSGEHARRFVDDARDSAYPRKTLTEVKKDIGKDLVQPQQQDIDKELYGVAAASGIAKEELTLKSEQIAADALKATQAAGAQIDLNAASACKDVTVVTDEELKEIAGAQATANLKVEQDLEAVKGANDPAVIEMKQTRLLADIETQEAEGKAAVRSAAERRETELNKAAGDQSTAYKATALQEAKEIRAAYVEAGADEEKARQNETEGRLQSRPSLDWGDARVKAVGAAVARLQTERKQTADDLITGLVSSGTDARAMVRDWADKQAGRERGWLTRLIERFEDWQRQARADTAAWSRERNKATSAALTGDFAAIESMRAAIVSGNKETLDAAFTKLTDDQKLIVLAFFNKETGGDAIAAVAGVLIVQMEQRRLPPLVDDMRHKSETEITDAESLNLLAASEAPDGNFNAFAQATQVHDAISGWGTNHGKLLGAIERRTPMQLKAIKAAYAEKYSGSDMEADIKDKWAYKHDLTGDMGSRVDAALTSDNVAQDAATLHDAVAGLGTDEKAIMKVLRNKSPEEVKAIKARYKEMFKVELKDDLEDDMSGDDMDRANALLDSDVRKADAIGLHAAAKEWFGSKGDIQDIYDENRKEIEATATSRNLTTAEIHAEVIKRNEAIGKAYSDTYAQDEANTLSKLYDKELNQQEADLAKGLQANDQTAIDAALIRIEQESFITSDNKVNDVLRSQYERAVTERQRDLMVKLNEDPDRTKWSPEEYKKKVEAVKAQAREEAKAMGVKNMEALNATYDKKYSRWGPGELTVVIEFNMSGYAQEEARMLRKSGGYETDAQRVYYAIYGLGTNEKQVDKALEGKSPAEIQELRAEYRRFTKEKTDEEQDLDEDIKGDYSGRELHDVTQKLKGEPQTPREKYERQLEDYLYETGPGSGLGTLFAGDERKAMEYDLKRAEQAYKDYEEAEKTFGVNDPRTLAKKERFDVWAESMDADVASHRAAVDTVTNTVAMVAAVVVGVAVSILTAGAASPAVVAAIGALAGTLAAVDVKLIMKGQAYGAEEMGTDLAMGGVDAVVAACTAGIGNALLRVGGLAKMAEGAMLSRIIAHGLTSGAEGMISGIPSGLLGLMLDKNTWESGDPMATILHGMLIHELQAGASAFALGGILGGVPKPHGVPHAPTAPHETPHPTARATELPHADALAHPAAVKPPTVETPPPHPQLEVHPQAAVKGEPALKAAAGTEVHPTPKSEVEVRGPGRAEHGPGVTEHAPAPPERELPGAPRAEAEAPDVPRTEAEAKLKQQADAEAQAQTEPPTEAQQHAAARARGDVTEIKPELDVPRDLEPTARAKELAEGLPPGMRRNNGVPIEVDPTLESNSVRVQYDVSEGLITNIRIKAGAGATVADIAAHVETVKLMRRYSGLSGRIRRVLRGLGELVGIEGGPEVGTRAWEAHLEVKKLSTILQDRIKLLSDQIEAGLSPDLEAEFARLNHLQEQLALHEQTLASESAATERGRGYVAAEGRNYQRARAKGYPELPEGYHYVERPDGSFYVRRGTEAVETGLTKQQVKQRASGKRVLAEATGDGKTLAEVREEAANAFKAARKDTDNAARDFETMLQGMAPDMAHDADKGLLYKAWQTIQEVHPDLSPAKRRQMLEEVLKDLEPPLNSTSLDTIRHTMRDQTLRRVMAEATPQERIDALREFLDRQPDPGSKGHLFTAFVKEQLGTLREFTPLEGKTLAFQSRGRTRIADGAVEISGAPRKNGPEAGTYLMENKSGEGAFKLDQAQDYSAKFPRNGKPFNLDGTSYDGLIYVADSEQVAAGIVGELNANKLSDRIHVAYYDSGGNLKFMARK